MSKTRMIIGMLVGLLLAGGAGAERLNVQTTLGQTPFKLHNETLSSQEKMGIILRMAEDFVGYAETHDIYFASDEYEACGGYFNASGHGVAWGRGGSNLSMVYAVLLSEQPSRQVFTKHDISRSQLVNHLENHLRSMCMANKNCSRYIEASHTWGGPAWQTSLDFLGAAWASHLMESELSADTLALTQEIITLEADNLDKTIPSGTPGDTRSEDCCWNAPFLAFAANKFASDPRASNWDYLAKKWAMNAVSTPEDATCTDLVDGVAVQDWICTENLFSDLTLENHGFWSIGYQVQMMMMADGELAYLLFGNSVPEAFYYHADDMWEDVGLPVSMRDGDYLYASGQDWYWKTYTQTEYFARQFLCRGNSGAAAFESRSLQMAYLRQRSNGMGDMSYDFGTSTVGLRRNMMVYMLHKHWPNSAKRKYDEMAVAEASQYGVYDFPYVKVGVHRTSQKLVSVSWHQDAGREPIYVIPDRGDMFTDPPLNITYNNMSGNAAVSVSSGGASQTMSIVPGVVTEDSGSMTVRYQRKWGSAVTQYVTVVSLSDEATVYLTHFKAEAASSVSVGPLFPVYPDFAEGFNDKTFEQFRGEKWLNINDCMGFVSPVDLPSAIAVNKFVLKNSASYSVAAGEWFSPAAVVVYVYQGHTVTESLKDSAVYGTPTTDGDLVLDITSSTGNHQVSLF